jgi:hypothetical protein
MVDGCYTPPLRVLYTESATEPMVAAAIQAFGQGTSSLYDTHPLHAALIAQFAGPEGGVAPEGDDSDDPSVALDRMLVASAFGPTSFTGDEWTTLTSLRHGPLLRAMLDLNDVESVRSLIHDARRCPWQLTAAAPADHRRPLAEFERTVASLVLPTETALAADIVVDIDVATAVADMAMAFLIADRRGGLDEVAGRLQTLVADPRLTHTWRTYRGPILYLFEVIASGTVLDDDDVELALRLLHVETTYKFVPTAGTEGRFDLTESFVMQDQSVRETVRRLWHEVFADRCDIDTARRRHEHLCGEAL